MFHNDSILRLWKILWWLWYSSSRIAWYRSAPVVVKNLPSWDKPAAEKPVCVKSLCALLAPKAVSQTLSGTSSVEAEQQ